MLNLTRRQLVQRASVSAGALALAPLVANATSYGLSDAAKKALVESPLVYISPLQSSGEESSCHGEVWYYVDGSDVIIGSENSTWKVRALDKGLDRARVWVADYGPEWRALNRYRSAPGFLAQVSVDQSQRVFDDMMQGHARRYGDEWGKWDQRFREQYAAGTRKILRYTPIGD
jgi:hypothetical protein